MLELKDFPQFNLDQVQGTKVVFKTNKGDITIQLFDELAPKTVENFVTHVKNGYYNGQIFHRVIKDFMIQGGDPTGTGFAGESIWGKAFEDEFNDNLVNLRGALSMANAGPNTNGSQFFIVQAPKMPKTMTAMLDAKNYSDEVKAKYIQSSGTPWLDGKHTVFGQVIEGMDVVDDIAFVATDFADKPLEDVKIESIEVL